MDDLLQQGITAYKAGERDEARNFFINAVKQNPDNIHAWGWMYNFCNIDKDRIYCLKQIIRINPKAEIAQLLLYKLSGDDSYSNPKTDTPHFKKKLKKIKQLQEQSFTNYKDYVNSVVTDGAEEYFSYLDITGDIDNALAYADAQFSEALSSRLKEQGVKSQIRFVTSEDEKVCPICAAADHKLKNEPINIGDTTSLGQKVSESSGWNGQSWGQRFGDPPFHKGCRCTTIVERLR